MKNIILIVLSMLFVNCNGTVIKSNVAARHSQYLAIEESWPIPYITDGLIGLWDGEWNAGYEVHDANATTWKDISWNGRSAILSGTYSWGDNYWHVESVSGCGLAAWPAQNLGEDQTIEFVIECIDRTAYGRVIAEAQGVASPILRPYGLYMYGYGIDGGATIGDKYDGYARNLHQIVHSSGGPMHYYINGVLLWTAEAATGDSTGSRIGYFANRSTLDRGIDANYFTIRRYNRALSDDELLANYGVDKERFNLP